MWEQDFSSLNCLIFPLSIEKYRNYSDEVQGNILFKGKGNIENI